MTTQPSTSRAFRHLILAVALTTLAAAEVQGQSGIVESWRDSAGNWRGKRHALDPAGNLLVVGDTVVGDIIQVRRYSPAGQLLWSRIYDPPERVVSHWVATDFAGNAWIAAARITGSQNSPVGFLVLKYDAQGNLLFVDVTPGGMAVRALTDSEGNGYVIGAGWITGAADIYMVVKYAPDGTRLWTGFLESGSSTFLGAPTSLALSPDETRLVVAGGASSTAWHALSVAMFDTTSGQRLWNHLDTSKYGARDVAFSPDGASVYVGSTEIFLNPTAMALQKFDLAGNRVFSRTYADGNALIRLAVDGAGNVLALGTALPLPGSAYRDWMTLKVDAGGARLWARRYDATRTNDEVPEWVTVDGAGAVYVAGMGGPSPSFGNVSFLKPVTQKYDAAGTPVWAIFNGGNAQVTVSDPEGGSVFTLDTNQMTSARFEQTGSTDPVPAAPSQLGATGYFNGFENRIDLLWTDNATTEFWHAVERCAGAGCSDFVEIGRALGENGTGFRDAALPAGATFTYRVRAVGFTGASSYSNTATASTPASGAPAAPTNLVATVSGNAVQLTWADNSTDETGFAIERCAGGACSIFTPLATVGANVAAFLDGAVVGGEIYTYRVRATRSGTSSAYSNVASVTTPRTGPTAPTNLAASSTVRRRIRLTWTNTAADATSITVERCAGSTCTGFAAVAGLAATATSWTDVGVRSGSTYRYRVSASNAAGVSPYSNVASTTAR